MKILFVKKKTPTSTASRPSLVMREIFSDAMPEGISGDLDALKRKLVEAEKVHPLRGEDEQAKVRQLEQSRLAKSSAAALYDKHCYGLFERETGVLRTVVYVQLRDIAKDAGKPVEDSSLPGNIHRILTHKGEAIDRADAAIFYSISSMGGGKAKPDLTAEQITAKQKKVITKQLGKALQKAVKQASPMTVDKMQQADVFTNEQLSEGEQLIRAVAQHVKKAYGIKAFSTLSPMRSGTEPDKITGFASWLKGALSGEHQLLTNSEREFLSSAAQAAGPQANDFERILYLYEHRADLNDGVRTKFSELMKDLGIYYIAYERNLKTKDRPLDPVTAFHISNGAKLANIHYLPSDKSTELDSMGSLGMMVNYRYEPDMLAKRKVIAKTEDTVPLTPAIAAHYTARLGQLEKPFKTGKRSSLPTTPAATGKPIVVGNTLILPQEQRQNMGAIGCADYTSWAARAGNSDNSESRKR
jgi:hypothetical protein